MANDENLYRMDYREGIHSQDEQQSGRMPLILPRSAEMERKKRMGVIRTACTHANIRTIMQMSARRLLDMKTGVLKERILSPF